MQLGEPQAPSKKTCRCACLSALTLRLLSTAARGGRKTEKEGEILESKGKKQGKPQLKNRGANDSLPGTQKPPEPGETLSIASTGRDLAIRLYATKRVMIRLVKSKKNKGCDDIVVSTRSLDLGPASAKG